MESNFFLGDGERRAGGVRLQGEDQVVVNNLFRGLQSFGVRMMDGTPDNLYIRTERALVAFNTFIGCNPGLRIGINHSKYPNGSAPKDCVIANNVFVLQSPDVDGPSGNLAPVDLVQDDEPVDWVWEGNVIDGPLGDAGAGWHKLGRHRAYASVERCDSAICVERPCWRRGRIVPPYHDRCRRSIAWR